MIVETKYWNIQITEDKLLDNIFPYKWVFYVIPKCPKHLRDVLWKEKYKEFCKWVEDILEKTFREFMST